MERRLAAILAADMVGYSRLMGADEAGTLAAYQRHRRDLINPRAAQYHGRICKLTGDGVLMEFASVIDAIRFAVEVPESAGTRSVPIVIVGSVQGKDEARTTYDRLLSSLPALYAGNVAHYKALLDRSVLVRDCSGWPRLTDCLRVTVGTPEENDVFLTSLHEIVGAA